MNAFHVLGGLLALPGAPAASPCSASTRESFPRHIGAAVVIAIVGVDLRHSWCSRLIGAAIVIGRPTGATRAEGGYEAAALRPSALIAP